MKILNIETFSEEDLPEVFKIGYLSNDAICVLSKVLRRPKNEIVKKDIDSLREILTLLKDVEKGKETIESYQYSGSASNNVSIYWQLIKLINTSTEKSFEQIIEEISKNREQIEEILSFLKDKVDISDEEIIGKVSTLKNFLTLLSKNYQNVFFKH